MIKSIRHRLRSRSAAILLSLEAKLGQIMICWLLLVALASAVRIALSPTLGAPIGVATLIPYALLVLAPVASMVIALRWFAEGERMPQPEMRFARIARWRELSRSEARRHSLFGPRGLMLSLLIGILLNVPVRTVEFLVALPAITVAAPGWLLVLHTMMTFDVVLLSSLYAVAFVAALRCVPLFPRLLVSIWLIDLMMQLLVAQLVVGAAVPGAIAAPLQEMLEGNAKKVLVSVALWLPYLLLSRRVNVTYRHRVRA